MKKFLGLSKDWTKIHPDFAEKPYWRETCQQIWEECDLTYQDAQEWIAVGFEPEEYNSVLYLKWNKFTPAQYLDLKNKTPQECLNKFYPNKNQVDETIVDETIKVINWNSKSGELVIDNYPNLKKIDGEKNSKITKLTIRNCEKLEEIGIRNFKNLQQLILNDLPELKILSCEENKLTTLDLSNLTNLQNIYCSKGKLTEIKLPTTAGEKLEILGLDNNNFNQDLFFLKDLVNLGGLYLFNNKFKGSLEYLKNMNNLQYLYIDDTDLDSGLEYLPESAERFNCSTDERKDAKVKAIYNLLADENGKVEIGTDGKTVNLRQKLKEYKPEKLQKLKPEAKDEIKKNLDTSSFSSERLNQQLISDGYSKDWQVIWMMLKHQVL